MSRFLRPDAEVAAAYLELRARVVALLRELPEADAGRVVPHCPAWTVAELSAHLVGVPDDILAGRMEGVTTEAWTQAQVERLRGRTLTELADHYEAGSVAFDPVLAVIPAPVNAQLVMDAVTHEHDLRHAVGRPGARDSTAVAVGQGWLLNMVERRAPELAEVLAGSGIASFDVLRVLSGRRSAGQIAALGLDGAAITALLAGSPLRPPVHAVGD